MPNRVLLVEHDEVLRNDIVRAFRARGVGVDPFSTPEAALQAVQAGGDWSRALLALDLPGMDGATLCEQLRQHLPSLEATFITAGVAASVLCRAHGLGTVIWKPVGLGPLCERFCSGAHVSGTFQRRIRRSSVGMRAVRPASNE